MEIPKRWTFEDSGVAAGFDAHVREQLPWYELATASVAQIVRHYLPKGGLVYDFGCSTGNVGNAIAATLIEREGRLIPVDDAKAMQDAYQGPQPENLIHADAAVLDLETFDVAVCFLVLMFMPVTSRIHFIKRLREKVRLGGVIIVLDRSDPPDGYLSIVTSRLVLAAKMAANAEPRDILLKELSLGGVQRPIDPAILGETAFEWFRFGDFAGWMIEA